MGKTNKNRKRFSQKKAKVKSNREVKSNPFEIRLNRQKHPILGKKRKHEKGNPGIARSKAVEKVMLSLLFDLSLLSFIIEIEQLSTVYLSQKSYPLSV